MDFVFTITIREEGQRPLGADGDQGAGSGVFKAWMAYGVQLFVHL